MRTSSHPRCSLLALCVLLAWCAACDPEAPASSPPPDQTPDPSQDAAQDVSTTAPDLEAEPEADQADQAASPDAAADPSDLGVDPPDAHTPDLDPQPDAITYYQHVSPLIQSACAQCHTEGGIGPFSLKTYGEVRALSPVILASVEAKRMPPWPPEAGCGDFRHERTLTSEQLQTLRDWAAQGHLEGDAAREVIIPNDPAVSLGTPDRSIHLGVAYKPNPPGGKFDDYRCFITDPQITEEKLLNGSQVIPGNPSIVHHVLYYAIPEAQHARLAQLDASEDGPGYTCFGGPRINDAILLGGWVPGSTPIQFDPNHGITIPKNSRIVIQVHYNTMNDAQGSDRTKIDLHFAENNFTKLAMLPLAQSNLNIQPGDANAVATYELQLPDTPLLRSIRVYGVVPHMHELGKTIRVNIERDGQDLCLVNIPKWDFNWQGFYLYKTPLRLAPNDKVTLTCTYDNSMARNEQLGREPRVVRWGEGTQDEMCLSYVIVTDPGIF